MSMTITRIIIISPRIICVIISWTMGANLKGGSEDFHKTEGNSQKIGRYQALIDAISGLMADFLRLIDVNAGGLRLKRGQGILHLRLMSSPLSVAATAFRRGGERRSKQGTLLTIARLCSHPQPHLTQRVVLPRGAFNYSAAVLPTGDTFDHSAAVLPTGCRRRTLRMKNSVSCSPKDPAVLKILRRSNLLSP